MSYILGLTGSIGMGKSTTGRMFADLGCALWDADAAVHRMYAAGGDAVAPIRAEFPDAVGDDAVSRDVLKDIIARDPTALSRLERIVHPLVAMDRQAFLEQTTANIVVLDIPLLFEGGFDAMVDGTVCVTAPPEMQQARVLERGTMTEAQFQAILAKQMPDAEKQRRATWIVITDTVEHARAQVQDIVTTIRRDLSHA